MEYTSCKTKTQDSFTFLRDEEGPFSPLTPHVIPRPLFKNKASCLSRNNAPKKFFLLPLTLYPTGCIV